MAHASLSALIQIYNEAKALPASLGALLPAVDQVVIVDGSECGPSNDGSKEIVESFISEFPDKIVYLSGTYIRDDGSWDETPQNNLGYAQITSDFVMRTHADLIYDTEDICMMREVIDRFPHKKYFYCPHLEFFVDTGHILLSSYIEMETKLPRHPCGDVAVVSMSLNPHFADIGDFKRSALEIFPDWKNDIVFMPHVKRFHYGYVKPFASQVEKIVKYVRRGDFEQKGRELLNGTEEELYKFAIKSVLGFYNHPRKYVYGGLYPKAGEVLCDMTISAGQDEFLLNLSARFGTMEGFGGVSELGCRAFTHCADLLPSAQGPG